MTNNTTANNTESNMTSVLDDTGGLMDLLSSNMEIFAVLGILILAGGAYGWFYVPSIKVMIMKLIKKHDAEILELYEKHLTPKMRKQLDAAAEKHVKDEILKQIVMTAFDHTEDKAQGTVKKLIRDIAKES